MMRPWHSLSASSHGSFIFTGCPPVPELRVTEATGSASPNPHLCLPAPLAGGQGGLACGLVAPSSLCPVGPCMGTQIGLASEASLGKGCVGARLACGVRCSGVVRKWSLRASWGTMGRPRRSPGFLVTRPVSLEWAL